MTTLSQALARATYYAAYQACRDQFSALAIWGDELEALPYHPKAVAAEVYLSKWPQHNRAALTLAQRLDLWRDFKYSLSVGLFRQ